MSVSKQARCFKFSCHLPLSLRSSLVHLDHHVDVLTPSTSRCRTLELRDVQGTIVDGEVCLRRIAGAALSVDHHVRFVSSDGDVRKRIRVKVITADLGSEGMVAVRELLCVSIDHGADEVILP